MSSTLDEVYRGLRRQLLCPLSEPINHLPESSIGLTAASGRDFCENSHHRSFVRHYMQEKDNQLQHQRMLYYLQHGNASSSEEDGGVFNLDEISESHGSAFASLDKPIILKDTRGKRITINQLVSLKKWSATPANG